MKATMPGGDLVPIPECYIQTGDNNLIYMKILPEISDSKGASYPEEPLMGRATPLKTYSHSETRTISWAAHFMTCKEGDAHTNLATLRSIESCVYPKDNSGTTAYEPPNLCHIKCGIILGDSPLCCVMKSYSVKFDPGVAWDEETFVPYKFDVDMTFEVVYDSEDLPGSDRIFTTGL